MQEIEKQLIDIINSLENYEEATEALVELKKVNKDKAMILSERILNQKLGDVYFQSMAFHILYSLSEEKAILFAKNNLSDMSPYLLGTVIETVTEESGIIDQNVQLKKFVEELKIFLTSKNETYLAPIKESLDWFYETYGKPKE